MSWVLTVAVAVVAVWIAFAIIIWATGGDHLRDNAPDDAPPGLGEDGPVSEESVGALRFDTGARGYRTVQVDAALARLAWEIGRRDEQLAELEQQLGAEHAGITSGEPAETQSADAEGLRSDDQ